MLGLVVTLVVAGFEERTHEQAADAFLAAWRARDEVAMARLSDTEKPDPFFVANVLFGRHVAGSLREPPEPGDFLAAAAELAARVERRKIDAGLPALVRRWSTLGMEDLRREAQLRAGQPAEADFSVTRIRSALDCATTRRKANRPREAEASYREAAAGAAAIGWTRARLLGLHGVGFVVRQQGKYLEALVPWEEELRLARELDRREEVALQLMVLGETHGSLHRFPKAQELLEQAVAGLEALGNRRSLAIARTSLGWVLKSLDRDEEARCCLEQALRDGEAVEDRGSCGRARMALGTMSSEQGRHQEALELLKRSAQDLAGSSERRLGAGCLIEMGWVHFHLGQMDAAESMFERAQKDLHAVGDRAGVGRALVLRGKVDNHYGRYAKALERFEHARRIDEELGLPGVLTICSIADLHNGLGLRREALELLEPLLRKQMGVSERKAVIELIAIVRIGMGDLAPAIGLLQQSLDEMNRHGQRAALRPQLLKHLGNAWRMAGHFDMSVECYERALDELQELADTSFQAKVRASLGGALALAGRLDEALETLESARRTMESSGDRRGRYRCLFGLARVRSVLGPPDEVICLARAALSDIHVLDQGLGEDEAPTSLLTARSCSDLALTASHRIASGDPSWLEQALADAYWSIEAGRGLSLTQGLLNRPALFDTQLPPALRSAHAGARVRVQAALTRLAGPAAVDARAELDAAYRDLEAASRRIQREAQRSAQILYPEPNELAATRAMLPDRSPLVLYQLTDSRALALVVSSASAHLIDLGASSEMTTRLDSYLRILSARGAEGEPLVEADQAQALYQTLLRPLEPFVAGADRLLISPDGALSFLPFEALLRVEGTKKERAIERWEIAYLPSGTVLATLLHEARAAGRGEGLLALGDPAYPGEPARSSVTARLEKLRGFGPLERLPATADEVRELATLFSGKRSTVLLGEEASVSRLVEALKQPGGRLAAVHLACHGFVDAERPRLTGLVLAGGEVLGLDDLYRLRIPADLAVLSACETGKGKLVTGQGVVGLVRGFFFAGVPRVIVSDWKVSDAGTRSLMVALYRKMIEEKRPPGAALRAAKLESLRAGGARAHPSHWAAFVLWGLPD